ASGRRAGLLLVALGQLGLDHLPRFPAPQRADEGRIEDDRDDERDHEGDRRQQAQVVSSLTTWSRRIPCDPLTRTRSPSRACFLTHATAAARSETTSAPA